MNIRRLKIFFILPILLSCEFEFSNSEIKSTLNEFDLTLIEPIKLAESAIVPTHIDYHENFILKLSEVEFKNLETQIRSSSNFSSKTEFNKRLQEFKKRIWTYNEVFETKFQNGKDSITDPEAIEGFCYQKYYNGNWVEKIGFYTKRIKYYKQDKSTNAEIFITPHNRELHYSLRDD